jgi:hypothetical protein
MARNLFIDLTNRRLVASETNSAPVGLATFTKGDNGAFNLYFLETTGVINRPFEVVDKSSTSVKLGIGSRLGVPESGTYTLTFGGDTTSAIDAAATAGAIQTALNGLSAISSAGGVSVTGELADHFTVRFTTAGTQGSIAANVSQLIPDTVAVIDERIAGSASVKEIQEIQLRLTPAVYQDSWTNLGTAVTATIATTVTGDASNNEVQRLSFSREPFAGSYRLTYPTQNLSDYATGVIGAVTSGIFSTISNHGLALNQPLQIDFTGTVTGLTDDQIYFVKTVPQPTQFTVAATAGGTLITSSATTAFDFTTITRQTAPISATASAADVQAALQSLDSIGAGGVIVTGIPGEYFDITFSGPKGYSLQSFDGNTLTIQNGTTAKPGKTADVNFSTFALRDLLGNSAAVDLDLELELTESGTRQTVILQACSVAEELIDADSFSPTSGYPSFIFQALTAAATNATTSLVAITALNWTAQANSEYLVEWNLLCKSEDADGNIDGQVAIPAGATQFSGLVRTIGNSSLSPRGASLASRDVIFDDDGNVDESFFNMQKMYLQTGSTAGTVSFRFAQNTTTTGFTAVIEQGSWVRAEKVK